MKLYHLILIKYYMWRADQAIINSAYSYYPYELWDKAQTHRDKLRKD